MRFIIIIFLSSISCLGQNNILVQNQFEKPIANASFFLEFNGKGIYTDQEGTFEAKLVENANDNDLVTVFAS